MSVENTKFKIKRVLYDGRTWFAVMDIKDEAVALVPNYMAAEILAGFKPDRRRRPRPALATHRGLSSLVKSSEPVCKLCELYDEVHDQNCPEHPEYDPTPWCNGCGARKKSDCDCPSMAANE